MPSAPSTDTEVSAATGWAVSQSVLRFYLDFDNWRYDRMAQAFLPTGTWDRNGLLLRGREAIVDELSRRPRTAAVRHVITNIVVAPAASPPSGVPCCGASFYVTAYRSPHAQAGGEPPVIKSPYLILEGTAELRLHEGRWRFTHQSLKRLFEFPA